MNEPQPLEARFEICLNGYNCGLKYDGVIVAASVGMHLPSTAERKVFAQQMVEKLNKKEEQG